MNSGGLTTVYLRSGAVLLLCHECGKTGPAEEWAYGHDCEPDD